MPGTGGFQTFTSDTPVMAIEGDFASNNPYFNFDAGPGGLVAGPSGLIIGRFAWAAPPVDLNGTNKIANNFGVGPVSGFVHRTISASITQFLAFTGMTILPGQQVTLMSGGDFWVKNYGSNLVTPGMKVYADLTDGRPFFGATGAPLQGFSSTASVAASTFSVTGSIANNILNVTVVGSGVVVPGATISGTGIATGTKVVSQISGAAGGVGTYYVDTAGQTVASTTVSGTYGTMTVTAVGSGALEVGDVIAGSGVVAGTTITAFGTGTGNTGTYIVNNNTVVSSTTVTGVATVETKWFAMSEGLTNELVKISDHPLG